MNTEKQIQGLKDVITGLGSILSKPFFSVLRNCDPGYFGKNCRAKCAYPYYGEECQGQCDCDEDSCNVSIGCTNATKGIVSHKCSESCFQLFQAIIIQHET